MIIPTNHFQAKSVLEAINPLRSCQENCPLKLSVCDRINLIPFFQIDKNVVLRTKKVIFGKALDLRFWGDGQKINKFERARVVPRKINL